MAYEKSSVDNARQKGLFGNNVFDPKVLTLDDNEKKKLQEKLTKTKSEMQENLNRENSRKNKSGSDKEKTASDNDLTFMEKILVFIMNFFGTGNLKTYRANKAVHIIERELARIKPPIYNPANKRITKGFAYRIHDLFLKLLGIKRILDKSIGNPSIWNNPDSLEKTGVEILFERLAGLDMNEIDDKFSPQRIADTLMSYDKFSESAAKIEKDLFSYLNGVDTSVIEPINRIYTNIIYFQKLCSFEFIPFFRRFDQQFTPGASPNFIDISGEAIASYLMNLEECLLQIDLSLDNQFIFKKMNDISNYLIEASDIKKVDNQDSSNPTEDFKTFDNNLHDVFETLKDLLYRNYFTLLIKVIKKNPSYSPGFIHTKYDLHKLYVETMERRVKNLIKATMRDKKRKKTEEVIVRVFGSIKWIGLYNSQLSDKLEKGGYSGFTYNYQIAVINTFLSTYYEEIIKNIMNIVLMSGVFTEKNFQKNVSDVFYGMEKFQERFREFAQEMNPEGLTGKKIIELLSRHEGNPADTKKVIERNIAAVNSRAQEIYTEFYEYFVTMNDLISKMFSDIESKPPSHVRNIRSIGGLKNARFLNYLEKGYGAVSSIKEAISLLKD